MGNLLLLKFITRQLRSLTPFVISHVSTGNQFWNQYVELDIMPHARDYQWDQKLIHEISKTFWNFKYMSIHAEGEWSEEYMLQYHVATLPATYQLEIIIVSCKYYRGERCLYLLINKQQFSKVVLIGQAIGNLRYVYYLWYGYMWFSVPVVGELVLALRLALVNCYKIQSQLFMILRWKMYLEINSANEKSILKSEFKHKIIIINFDFEIFYVVTASVELLTCSWNDWPNYLSIFSSVW